MVWLDRGMNVPQSPKSPRIKGGGDLSHDRAAAPTKDFDKQNKQLSVV